MTEQPLTAAVQQALSDADFGKNDGGFDNGQPLKNVERLIAALAECGYRIEAEAQARPAVASEGLLKAGFRSIEPAAIVNWIPIDGKWHCLAYVWGSADLLPTMYVDGVQPFRLGETAYWDRALSKDEIQAIYEAGVAFASDAGSVPEYDEDAGPTTQQVTDSRWHELNERDTGSVGAPESRFTLNARYDPRKGQPYLDPQDAERQGEQE